MDHRVAVVGAGWAGLAAAVTLAGRRIPVVVFEAARGLGGRARRVTLDGVELDNGQHILIGAYTETLRLMRAVGADPEATLARIPLELRTASGFGLKAAALPAPFHLLGGLLTAEGLTLGERMRAIRFIARLRKARYVLERDEPVAGFLAREGQSGVLATALWEPLCVSALNTPADSASAQVFATVLRDTIGGGVAASDLLLPKADLGTLFPEPAAAFVAAHGGEVRSGLAVRQIERDATGFSLDGERFSRVIVACAPQHAAALVRPHAELATLSAQLDALEHEPIYTCYLQYAKSVALPIPMLGFTGALLQWAFDRGALSGHAGLIAAVLSASGRHEALARADLAAALHAELAAALPGLQPPLWTRTVAEKRATFSCRPGVVRPGIATALPGLVLAGDYTASDYPATLESAVRSGIAAADLAAPDH